MGCGKSSTGRELARILGAGFVDLDELVVRREGRSIPEIFAGGEAAFRKAEAEALSSLLRDLDGSPLGIDSTMPATEAQVRYDGHSLLLPEGCSDVRVYSLSGVLVFAQDVADARTVSLDRLPQGVYLYMVNTPEGIATGKLAK